jgi:hypothetical protein
MSWSCDRGTTETEVVQEQASAAPTRVAEPAPCEFVRATRSLVTINVETANGECSVVLPAELTVGDLGVAISVAGRDDVAAVQITAGLATFYYANEGTVTVSDVAGGRVRGTFVVTDDNPPETGGPFSGEFDVPFE